MRIILTHEQADFDALASLLGAHLVDESSIPVLPRKMNRNVQAFVTLYGGDLPFVDPRDLSSEPIDVVTLVDTQSLVSLKGMSAKTRVYVIDHHAVRDDLPREWQVTTEETGATVTLFIEAIRERGGALSTIQATLLLLGVYEDTGSLTYTRTTARDLRAVAFLLEQGANLGLASNFLNHPLSFQQQEIYDELRSTIETHEVHGHSIVVACGDAQGMDEELSTIAHKLRDLLDPDGLFLLIQTRGGIQLISRSTSDNIDVSEIASYFGGGGHSRAAAALIRDRALDDVRGELIRILPRYVRPAITVSQIMSYGPQVLAPYTPVEEAANRMQRYGYEGYPVVQDGKVVGLLTRRAVDRAISHNLNLTASSLMEAGEVTVKPEDSIEQLQRLMTDTGWGQIPVVNPDNGQIVGIVTRTDLLKTLNHEDRLPGPRNLAKRLESALPPARLALLKAVADVAYHQRVALYIVGGFVRDLMLDLPSLDFDLVVEGDAIALARALSKKFGGRFTSHSRFGTAKWFVSENSSELVQALTLKKGTDVDSSEESSSSDLPDTLDFISARTEFYTYPTALPTVERGSIKLDLHRRDFTINTLALRLDGRHYGELHDYWGGLSDIRQRLVRCLHSLSFVDDPTRMLRAVRFEQRFNFQIEERTLQLLLEAVSLMDRVSGDRIRHELDHILDEGRVTAMLIRLDELKLLAAIHPDLRWENWLRERIDFLNKVDLEEEWVQWDSAKSREADGPTRSIVDLRRDLIYLLWMIRLPLKRAHSVLDRLKIPRIPADSIREACLLWEVLPSLVDAPPSKIVNRLDGVPDMALYGAFLAVSEKKQRDLLQRYVTVWRQVAPTVSGHDLVALGLRQGPMFREILSSLRSAWLDGAITSVEEETALLEKLIAQGKEDG